MHRNALQRIYKMQSYKLAPTFAKIRAVNEPRRKPRFAGFLTCLSDAYSNGASFTQLGFDPNLFEQAVYIGFIVPASDGGTV